MSDGGSYLYNADGRRLKKVEQGKTTYYFFNEYLEEYQGGNKTNAINYYFADKLRIAEKSTKNGVQYYHKDHLGSSTVVTNPSGQLVKLINYAPYGTKLVTQGTAEVKYGFTDKEEDATGLNYFEARYYDPELGRFISVDPDCEGYNWFTYCANNPIIYVDPRGLAPCKPVIDGPVNYEHDFKESSTKYNSDGTITNTTIYTNGKREVSTTNKSSSITTIKQQTEVTLFGNNFGWKTTNTTIYGYGLDNSIQFTMNNS